jgi:hypothetical protein
MDDNKTKKWSGNGTRSEVGIELKKQVGLGQWTRRSTNHSIQMAKIKILISGWEMGPPPP